MNKKIRSQGGKKNSREQKCKRRPFISNLKGSFYKYLKCEDQNFSTLRLIVYLKHHELFEMKGTLRIDRETKLSSQIHKQGLLYIHH